MKAVKIALVLSLLFGVSVYIESILGLKWFVVLLWFLPIITVIENRGRKNLSIWDEYWSPVFIAYLVLVTTLLSLFLM